jgi:hypothetical protein
MKRNFTLSLIALLLSFSSFATIGPISGIYYTCVGHTTTVSDTTAGGTWSSANTSIATIGLTTGVITGITAGYTFITYTVGGSYVTRTTYINALPAAIGGPSSVCVGSTITLSDATGGGAWSSSSSSLATVTSAGVVTGVSSGVVTITYTLTTGCYATKTISVTSGASITGPSSVCSGLTITLIGAPGGGTWTAGSTSVATVSSSGVVTGMSTGVTNIYYSVGGCYAYHTVSVTSGSSITGPTTVCAGSTITLSDATSGGAWSSSNTSIATIGITSGVVTGVSAGTTTIYYVAGGCSASKTITVIGGSSISGPSSVCVGSTATLSDATGGGSWISSNTAVATIGATSGVVTGLSTGTCTIYYSAGGCYAYRTFTVTSGAYISGYSTVCAGSTITLTGGPTGGTWSVGASSIATVSSSGVVTGVSSGVTNIYYSAGGCFAYHTVTVTGGATSITGPSSVCVGSTATLSDATGGGSWISSNTAVATIGATSGVVTGLSTGTCTIYYSAGGCYAYRTLTVSSSSSITGPSTVCSGSTITLTDAVSGGTWLSSSTAKATVSSTGVVTGVSSGVVNIYYSDGGCSAYHTVTVTGGASISGSSTVCIGSTITLSDATGGGTWTSSNTAVGTVSSVGVVTGISTGVVNIYYLVGGCYAYHTVTVTGGSHISGPSTVCVGATITLSDSSSGGNYFSSSTSVATVGLTTGVVTGVTAGTATIYYSLGGCYATYVITVTSGATITGPSTVCAGSTITLSDAPGGGTWSVGASSIATVSSGVVSGVSAGVTNIYYSAGGCFAYHTVTVTGGASSITGPSAVCVGSTVTLSDATGGGSWISSNTAVATIGATSGVVTGLSTGTCTIYYAAGGCYAYRTFTVTSGAYISGYSTVCAGSTITLTGGPTGGTWSVGASSIATVSSSGVVTGVSSGVTNIYYSSGGCFAYHTVTVTGGASISGPSTVCIGSTIALSDATGGGTWLSSSTAVGTVSSVGVVTGISNGVINIYYSVGGCYAYHTVTVTGGSHISGPSTVCIGATITLSDSSSGGNYFSSSTSVATVGLTTGVVTGISAGTATIYYSLGGCYAPYVITVTSGAYIAGYSTVCAGSTITLTGGPTGGTWSVGASSIATVSSSGVVTGVSSGVTNIYYSSGGCFAYHTVTVTGGATSITGPSSVCVGSTVTLSDATGGGSWISSNTAVATIGATSGVVTGLSTGTCTIYYSAGGCYAYRTFTVTSGAYISGYSTVCAGSTITLTGGPTGGTWSVGASSIATVSSSGVVTGVSSGVTNIYYSSGGCFAYHTVTVTGSAPISGPSAVCIGSTISLSDATPGGAWTSGNTAIALVDATGTVTGISNGVVNIYYSAGGCGAYHTVTVSGTSTISGLSSVCAGSSITLVDATPGGVWVSSDTSIAKVSSTGVVTGISAGVTTIYYTIGGCGAYHMVTVNESPAPITGPSTVMVGTTITLSDATPGGTWVSGNTALATTGSTGIVTGLSTGTLYVYYIIGTCGSYHAVSVTPLVPGAIDGRVISGDAKGTSAEIPVSGMQIYLEDGSGNIIGTTSTDNMGAYSFTSLADGSYIIYPQAIGYTTTPSAILTISNTSEILGNVDFKEYTGSKLITPYTDLTRVNAVVTGGEINIFPNPTTGILNIKWENQSYGSAAIVLADVTGREVYKSAININATSGQTQLDLKDLKNGLYLITIKSDNIYYSAKMMLQQ